MVLKGFGLLYLTQRVKTCRAMPLSRKLVRKIDLVASLCAVFPLQCLEIAGMESGQWETSLSNLRQSASSQLSLLLSFPRLEVKCGCQKSWKMLLSVVVAAQKAL